MKQKALLYTALIAFGLIGTYLFWYQWNIQSSQSKVQNGSPVTIPETIDTSPFGFLGGDTESLKLIKNTGAAWVRPHPGPFLWDQMQSKQDGPIDFTQTDMVVKEYQEHGVAILPTVWPFATWDQLARTDVLACKVSTLDEFLPKFNLFEDTPYLPAYRCNPKNWEAYATWVKALVERYDGDGVNDMEGLTIPIKYWEVLNEPDLITPATEETTLEFYKQGPKDYADLLMKTSSAIKEADPTASVLIAGAAGGNEQFLNFYRDLFTITPKIVNYFDIANVHCISNDSFESFNVGPYKKMLEEFSIHKPLWVTEAEAIVSENADVNATQTKYSAQKALQLGAAKIFFTRSDFTNLFENQGPLPPTAQINQVKPELDGSDAMKVYQTIFTELRDVPSPTPTPLEHEN